MRTAVALAAFVIGAGPALPTAGQPEGKEMLPLDAEFVKAASASNMAVQVAARFGTTRSSKVPVTTFAQRISSDQAKASEDLIKLAVKKKFERAKAVEKKDTDANVKMLGNEGAAFDRAFVERMVVDRKATIALYENQAKNGQDKDVKAYAEKHLPALRKQLEMGEELAGKLGDGKQ